MSLPQILRTLPDWSSFQAWAATQPLEVALYAARVWQSEQERSYARSGCAA